jgi:hypothetical protein
MDLATDATDAEQNYSTDVTPLDRYTGLLGISGFIGAVSCGLERGAQRVVFRRFEERDGRIFVWVERYTNKGDDRLPIWDRDGLVAFYVDDAPELLRLFSAAIAPVGGRPRRIPDGELSEVRGL